MEKIIMYILTALTLSFYSCSEWLDVQPKEEMGVEDMFSSEAGFKDGLTACYIKLYSDNLYGKKLTLSTIEHLAQHWKLPELYNEDVKSLKNFDYASESVETELEPIYSEMYNVIAQANSILNKFDDYGGSIRSGNLQNLIKGELLAIRAFCHSEILRLFGQVPSHATIQVSLPYVEEVTIGSLPFYDFNTFLEKVFQDIHEAETLLKGIEPMNQYTYAQLDNMELASQLEDEFFLCRRFRFNYYALRALEARLQLYVGNTSEAYQLAMEVIQATTESGEPLLQLGGMPDIVFNNLALPSECLLALNKADISGVIDNNLFMDENGVDEIFEGQHEDQNRKAAWWKKELVQGRERMLFYKYRQPDATEQVSSSDLMTKKQVIPLIRLSEMYLIAMETSPSIEEVNTLYADYMRAREVPVIEPLQEVDVPQMLEGEYRREFWGEGQMFYWYKRHQSRQMKWKTDREILESDYIVPLPKTEIRTN